MTTRKNTDSTRTPFLLKPYTQSYLWGGRKLVDNYAKNTDEDRLAESWECSTQKDGPSLVASGSFSGRLLADVLQEHPEMAGSHPDLSAGLPILIKLIDASLPLSVQVHPDDAYARIYEGCAYGKTEMWYVIDCDPGAELVYGFNRSISKETLRAAVGNGSIEKYLRRIPVHKGDTFYVKAGTVHAIGAGILLAEIQENSNLTYRMYDYGRKDQRGHLRQLQTDKALAVADRSNPGEPRQHMHITRYTPGCANTLLCRCKYFQVELWRLNTEVRGRTVKFRTESNSFAVLLCVRGCGAMRWENATFRFFRGDCIFVPADSCEVTLHGVADFLKVNC